LLSMGTPSAAPAKLPQPSPDSLSSTELRAQSERSWVRSQTCLVSSISKDNGGQKW